MPKGVKISNEVVGSGRELGRKMRGLARLRFCLNQGEEIWADYHRETDHWIDMEGRESIAGLKYGMLGMRAGGKRTLRISPHLAFGAKGNGQTIPPDAVLRCEVELLEVEGPEEPLYLVRVRDIRIDAWRNAMRPAPFLCSWILVKEQDDCCHTSIWMDGGRKEPAPGLPVEDRMALVAEALEFVTARREECLFHREVSKDLSEMDLQPMRETATWTPCVRIEVHENRDRLAY